MNALTTNSAVLSWIDEMAAITKPDNIVWIDGSEEQLNQLRRQAVEEGILTELNQEKLPGCYLHRTDPNDVARVEDRTYICCKNQEDAGPTNNWMDPTEMYEKMYALADGAYKGRTMYVIPYSMAIIGSEFAKYGFELTDSIYVVLNMHIMTRVGKAVCEALGDDTGFIKGLHCQCNLDKDNKYIVHFPEDNTIISMNSNYGGNVLQGKKCFALRIASNLGRQEGWMAEHMLILGIQTPKGDVKYVTAAFPS
ncbi:MAG: phosphoenolpyruvate carboxykinase (GTP), partial [Oscillospiraceae bacterium]|nr:phosphoenolpyruvate carboxykinase (GTP) [Oscillospiraceae bacterium]